LYDSYQLPIDTEEQKAEFARDPEKLMKYSKLVENELNQRFKFILKRTPEAEAAKSVSLIKKFC
jgi:hypothetical protein